MHTTTQGASARHSHSQTGLAFGSRNLLPAAGRVTVRAGELNNDFLLIIGSYRCARAGGDGVVPLRFRSSCLCRGPAPERGEATTKTRGSGHGHLGGWWECKKPHASTLMSITYEAVLGVRYSMMWDGQGIWVCDYLFAPRTSKTRGSHVE